jgi:hypothetical protein
VRHRLSGSRSARLARLTDVDVISGHVVFDYGVSRELAGALEIGAKVSPFAMI